MLPTSQAAPNPRRVDRKRYHDGPDDTTERANVGDRLRRQASMRRLWFAASLARRVRQRVLSPHLLRTNPKTLSPAAVQLPRRGTTIPISNRPQAAMGHCRLIPCRCGGHVHPSGLAIPAIRSTTIRNRSNMVRRRRHRLITAGASAPDQLVRNLIDRLKRDFAADEVETPTLAEENISV